MAHERPETRPLPLDGVRIISVEQYGAGPFATMHLADLGAEVIKVEMPATGGDVGRYVPPFQEGADSLFFQSLNRNKKSLALDLQSAAGREVFHQLVATADAVFSNLRGDLPARLGLTYADLRGVNPRIVCCSLSGFGQTGPRAAEPAYDYVLQGLAGWMSLTGEPGGPPTKSGLSLVDWSGGLAAALALTVGLHAARRDGVGLDCDVSLFDTAMAMLSYPAAWWLNEGYEVRRTALSAHPSLVPFQNFQTADGWIVVACPKEKFWARLVDVLESADAGSADGGPAGDGSAGGAPADAGSADDGAGALTLRSPELADFGARRRHADRLLPLLAARFRAAPTEVWLRRLAAAGVPAGAVNSIPEAFAEPQVAARDLVVEVPHATRGAVRVVASPVRVGQPRTRHEPAPTLHGDAAAILAELGHDAEAVAALTRRGAFGVADVRVDDSAPGTGGST